MNARTSKVESSQHVNSNRIALAIASALVAALLPLGTAAAALAPLVNENAPRRIAGQYIVVFEQGTSSAVVNAYRDRASRLGAKVGYTYTSVLSGFSASLPDNALQMLREVPEVEYVEVDQVGELHTVQTNPADGLDRVSERLLPLDQRYTYSETGANVHAYVIDTGIRATHNDFIGRILPGINTMNNSQDTNDCHGHGTHVAGTIGGTTYGIAKQALLHPVRAGDCLNTYLAPVIAAVDWVTANHVAPAVANLSSGFFPSPTLDNAVNNSIAAGVTYTVSAGNNSGNACNLSPARVPAAITVGSIDPTNDTRANSSNYGSCVDWFAPGVNILSASHANNTAAVVKSGTSMAAPHVAGVAARFLQYHPYAWPAVVRAGLHWANNHTGTPGWGGVINRGANSPNEQLHYGSLNNGYNDGDPHIITVNGLKYDFQAGGEFVALLGGPAMELQTRQTPAPGYPWVSINTALAARVGSNRVTWQPGPSGMQLRVDGVVTTLDAAGLALGAGGRVSPYGSNGIKIDFPDGTQALASSYLWSPLWYINLSVHNTQASEGLMGALQPGEWNQAGFADSWRVTDMTSLFDYVHGDSPAKYVHQPYPADKKPALKAENVTLAQNACAEVGDERIRKDCEFDVATTGAVVFAKSAKEQELVQRGATQTSLGVIGARGGDNTTLAVAVARLTPGEGVPAGSVRLLVDGDQYGAAVALDKIGRAQWSVPTPVASGPSVIAEYVPAGGSVYLPSNATLEYEGGIQ
ncbi:S8 family peptidase [Pseudomonas sp. CGJS7]|uniref:S8 family peptidase n=1 Tax=Pseudomonas sp. CGJS7 TaxID=3109348 RepID=UPI003007FB70